MEPVGDGFVGAAGERLAVDVEAPPDRVEDLGGDVGGVWAVLTGDQDVSGEGVGPLWGEQGPREDGCPQVGPEPIDLAFFVAPHHGTAGVEGGPRGF